VLICIEKYERRKYAHIDLHPHLRTTQQDILAVSESGIFCEDVLSGTDQLYQKRVNQRQFVQPAISISFSEFNHTSYLQ